MYIVGIDLETTGLDFEKDRIIEMGLVLWDTELQVPVRMDSFFVNELDRPKIDKNNVAAIITDEMLEEYGLDSHWIVDTIDEYVEQSDYIVAHNGNAFDEIMLRKFYQRYDYPILKKFWLDTITDIDYPKHCVARNLMYLAAFHGFVNPFPHRALFDVMTMLKILSHYDIKVVIARANSPTISFVAQVSYNDRGLAKDARFSWSEMDDCKYKGRKIWYKDIKECDVTDEWLDSLPFIAEVID